MDMNANLIFRTIFEFLHWRYHGSRKSNNIKSHLGCVLTKLLYLSSHNSNLVFKGILNTMGVNKNIGILRQIVSKDLGIMYLFDNC